VSRHDALAIVRAAGRLDLPAPGSLPLATLDMLQVLVCLNDLVARLREIARQRSLDEQAGVECAVWEWLAAHQLDDDILGELDLPDVVPCPAAFDVARAELAAFAFPRGMLH
jgi:hypothetical protein